jgi:ankyrin repeat protein
VNLLLDNGANINAQSEDDWTALQAASGAGHEAIVRLLLDKGADVTFSGNYGTALIAASRGGHEAIVQLLLASGADINQCQMVNTVRTALSAASENGHEKIVRLLLDKGADVTLSGKYGTALAAASREVMRPLLNCCWPVEQPSISMQRVNTGTALLQHQRMAMKIL